MKGMGRLLVNCTNCLHLACCIVLSPAPDLSSSISQQKIEIWQAASYTAQLLAILFEQQIEQLC